MKFTDSDTPVFEFGVVMMLGALLAGLFSSLMAVLSYVLHGTYPASSWAPVPSGLDFAFAFWVLGGCIVFLGLIRGEKP